MTNTDSSARKIPDILWTVGRILYGSWFIFFALFMLFGFGGHVPGSTGPAANAFLKALNAAGFVEPLLMIVYVVGGAALLLPCTVPLGIVMLAGPVAIIFLFHLFDTGMILWGSIWPIGLAALAWRFRQRLTSLWRNP